VPRCADRRRGSREGSGRVSASCTEALTVSLVIAAFVIFDSGVLLGVLVCRLTEVLKAGRHRR
jgi:hypothetical protein